MNAVDKWWVLRRGLWRRQLWVSSSVTRVRELSEVVNPQRLFNRGHPIDHLLEAVFAEELMFLLFKFFPERVEFVL
jgi:hypothetical protein